MVFPSFSTKKTFLAFDEVTQCNSHQSTQLSCNGATGLKVINCHGVLLGPKCKILAMTDQDRGVAKSHRNIN